jgi:hypothetical protein
MKTNHGLGEGNAKEGRHTKDARAASVFHHDKHFQTSKARDQVSEATAIGAIDPDEVTFVLDSLFENNLDHVRELLQDSGLKKSGPEIELRARMQEAVDSGRISIADVLRKITRVVMFGRQSGYLMVAPDSLTRRWRDKDFGFERLKQGGHGDLVGKIRPLFMPRRPTLCGIRYDGKVLRCLLVNERSWDVRNKDRIRSAAEENGYWAFFERKRVRAVSWFEWDLETGHAMLMIHELQRGTKYEALKKELFKALLPIVDLTDFELIPVSSAIRAFEESIDVTNHQLKYRSARGGKASITAEGRKQDALDDPQLKEVHEKLKDAGRSHGNFYLHKSEELDKQFHLKIFDREERFSIAGQKTEKEVRYVIKRLRKHCS